MSVNEDTGKCEALAFALVPEHVQKEVLELNGITLENRTIVIEDLLQEKGIQKICKKLLNVPL